MKLGFVIPFVGPAVSSATGLSAFCRGLEDVGYDTLWVGDRLVTPVNMHATYAGKEQPRYRSDDSKIASLTVYFTNSSARGGEMSTAGCAATRWWC